LKAFAHHRFAVRAGDLAQVLQLVEILLDKDLAHCGQDSNESALRRISAGQPLGNRASRCFASNAALSIQGRADLTHERQTRESGTNASNAGNSVVATIGFIRVFFETRCKCTSKST